jgi:EmrB/QacA subfamily drug resistance transporter
MAKDSKRSIEQAALIAVMSTSFMVAFMGSAINLALPVMVQEYASTATMSSWVVASYLLSSAAFLLPLGRLADIQGRRKYYLAGTILYTLFTLLSTLANSMETLIFWRLLQGVAAAMIFGTGMAILTSVYPPQQRGKAMGWSVSLTYTGLTLGPALGGFLTQHLGWRTIFYLTALLGLVAAYQIYHHLSGEWQGAANEDFDWKGSLFYGLGLISLLYGLSAITTETWAGALAILGVALLCAFAWVELRSLSPILNIRLFRDNQAFAFSNLAAMINYSSTFALTFLLSIYLQIVRGLDTQTAGLILLIQPVLMAVFSPMAGTLSDRIEPRLVASCGMALNTLCLLVLAFINENTSLWLVMVILPLIGLGFALFSSPNTNAVMSSVEPRFYGIASSTIGTMRLVGQSVCMAIATLIISIYVGQTPLNSASHTAITHTLRTSFITFTVLSLFGVFASLARGKVHQSPQSGTSHPSPQGNR